MKKALILTLVALCAACSPKMAPESAGSPTLFTPAMAMEDTKFYEARVKNDPQGALGWSMMAGARLRVARILDSSSDALAAEVAAQTSLKCRTLGNIGAMNRLIQALLAQHRFQDASRAVDQAVAKPLYDYTTLQLKAQIALETGEYQKANDVIKNHPAAFADPGGMTVLARNEALHGRPENALSLVQKARATVCKSNDAPGDVRAWFAVKEGDVLASMGKAEGAELAYQEALESFPQDYKALGGLTRLAAGRRDWKAVLERGRKAEEVVQVPEIEALIGDALAALGNKAQAERRYRQVAETAGKSGGAGDGLHATAAASIVHGHTLDRQYALFCADHDTDLEGAYAAALRDATARQDVYAFDTLAWVYFKLGRTKDAKTAIDKAMALGTQDARLFFHAGAIHEKLGKADQAKTFYRKASELNTQYVFPQGGR